MYTDLKSELKQNNKTTKANSTRMITHGRGMIAVFSHCRLYSRRDSHSVRSKMAIFRGWNLLLLLVLSVNRAHEIRAHICMITPRQRGDFDISQPGSKTCTRHQSPCGGQSAEAPRITYSAGKTALIRFQQNLNHYEVGLPGYMDVSLAFDPTSTEFRTLAVLGDSNEHAQWNQRNYTLTVVMPNVTCSHCVLRMRYVSHKAGEEIFYQCSDITIANSNATSDLNHENGLTPDDRNHIPLSLRRAFTLHKKSPPRSPTSTSESDEVGLSSPSLFGFAWNPVVGEGSKLVSINSVTGSLDRELSVYFGLGPHTMYGTPSPSAESDKFVLDQVVAYSREIPYVFLLEHRNGGLDERPNKILWIDMEARAIAGEYEIEGMAPGVYISTLNPYKRTNFLTFEMQPTPGHPGNFTLTFGTLDYMGNHFTLFTEPKLEDLYVNFLWATVDLTRNMYYVLMGNENAPTALNARIHSFNITSKNLTGITEIDVSRYTINAIQAYEKTGQLFAVTPGLFPQRYPPWHLVEVNPETGAVKHVMELAPAGMFSPFQGGAVVNIHQAKGVLYYVFRVADSMANIIATVTLDSLEVSFSQLTSLQNVHNIAYFDPYSP